jgi:hypothetical protein
LFRHPKGGISERDAAGQDEEVILSKKKAF